MTLPFVLGTAQFGSHYGVTNYEGQPAEEEVKKIISFALDKGINFFDSAFAYGKSLDFLAVSIKDKNHGISLINKFHLLDDWKEVRNKIIAFLRSSDVPSLYGLLIHDLEILEKIDIKKLSIFFKSLKDDGLVQKIGISAYSPQQVKHAVEKIPIDIIQCPLNLFDQRFIKKEIIEFLRAHKIEIHARSLFLQGLLLAQKLPMTFSSLKTSWEHYQGILQKYAFTPLQACIAWCKTIKHIDKWVIGVNKQTELAEILTVFQSDLSCPQEMEMLDTSNHPLIDPRNWSKP